MSDASSEQPGGLDWVSEWWLVLLVGCLSVIAGVIILAKPSDSLATLAVIAGVFVLVTGIVELVASLGRERADRGFLAVWGLLTVIVGVLLIRHPSLASPLSRSSSAFGCWPWESSASLQGFSSPSIVRGTSSSRSSSSSPAP